MILLGAAVLTLAPKLTHYSLSQHDVFKSAEQLSVDLFLAGNGWSRTGSQSLDFTGMIQAGRYTGATCAGEMTVLVVDPTGDTAAVIGDLAHDGDQLFFVHDGAASKDQPHYAPFREGLGRMLRSFHLSAFHAPPDLAIAAPARCHMDEALPWSAL